MNKTTCKILLLTAALVIASCSKDEEAPVIDSVWKNMISEPVAQTSYAYPGQTLCLHGSGFTDLQKIVVNGTRIDISSSLVYDTDNYVTFKLPADVATEGDVIKLYTLHGETTYSPFIVKPASQQPTIASFSSTTLTAGQTLTITGTNLDGATDVWLPLAFDDQVRCEMSGAPTATSITVFIPEGVSFATGKCVIAMQKTANGHNYTEHVYSKTTDFN